MNIDCFSLTEELPKPLSDDIVVDLFTNLKKNPENKRLLCLHNLRFVVYIIKMFANLRIEYDDLFQIGSIGLIKAIDTFEIEKGISFSTYATICIKNEILTEVRKQRKILKSVSLDKTFGSMESLSLNEVLEDPNNEIEQLIIDINNEESILLIESLLETLTPHEQAVLKMSFSKEKRYNQHQIAEKLGFSRGYISKIKKRALKKIKEKIVKQEKQSKSFRECKRLDKSKERKII